MEENNQLFNSLCPEEEKKLFTSNQNINRNLSRNAKKAAKVILCCAIILPLPLLHGHYYPKYWHTCEINDFVDIPELYNSPNNLYRNFIYFYVTFHWIFCMNT